MSLCITFLCIQNDIFKKKKGRVNVLYGLVSRGSMLICRENMTVVISRTKLCNFVSIKEND